MQKGLGRSRGLSFFEFIPFEALSLRMRKPPPISAAALPAASRLDRSTALVCLSLLLAVLMLAARIASIW
ncbi:hypothetical protein [Bradyrhizobium sp.]|uniref:hypothetical protein n=1 Tax=Bradyrhizobium sp. TaxID=376 RepID=UPI004037DB12